LSLKTWRGTFLGSSRSSLGAIQTRPVSAYPESETPGGAYWDDVVEGWTPTLTHRLWRAHSDAVNGRLLQRWLRPGQGTLLKTDLFDEAVGRGLYPELAARAEAVVGVDVSPAAVRAASQRYPDLDAQVASVLALPFPDASLDAVVSNSTLDHFKSHALIRAAAVELARTIRPGGQLIITLDNRTNPVIALRTSILFGSLHRLGVVPYFVGATHGRRGLARLLDDTGFDLQGITSIMHCPPQLAACWTARRGTKRSAGANGRHLQRVLRFEAIEQLPTRYLTGHFVAALAVRR
jgi:SAM-dependent methyltransferase